MMLSKRQQLLKNIIKKSQVRFHAYQMKDIVPHLNILQSTKKKMRNSEMQEKNVVLLKFMSNLKLLSVSQAYLILEIPYQTVTLN